MVEPPSYPGRTRVFEIDDDVFVPIKRLLFKRRDRPMGHPRVAKHRLRIDPLPVKSREDRRGGSTVKAAVMKAETNLRRFGQKILARGKKAEELATTKPHKMDVRPAIVKRKPGTKSS
jgi:hypothetical protein